MVLAARLRYGTLLRHASSLLTMEVSSCSTPLHNSILTADKSSEEAEESAAVSEASEGKQDLEAAENTIEPQATEAIQGKIILRGKRNA